MCTHMQKDHVCMLRSCGPCQSLVNYKNTNITQHALKSVRVLRMLKLDTIEKEKELIKLSELMRRRGEGESSSLP